ncbi:MAG: FxDxF family PEP-CTERM protein [Burkholderiales bacterium]|nr:FxDxF family PEP-CTERM protein [Burkholderiales bacterium]
MTISKVVTAAALALAAMGAQAELVVNGSFEADAQANGTWSTHSNLTGWTGMTNIELRNNVAGQAQDGVNFVELDTTRNMSMKQTITGNGLYQLSFWYSAREGRAAGDNGLDFSFGSLSGSVLQTTAGAASGHVWQHYTGLVTLTGATDLVFSAVGASTSYGGSLDNVSVTAVPEPETYAMLLAGLGVMGAVARRRKAQQA